MSRQVNEERPRELRDSVLEYLIENGVNDLSLRPLAKAVGSSPRGLLYHFGSKEKMLMAVVGELRAQQREQFSQMAAETFVEVCGAMWRRISSAAWEPRMRLFFELYGTALRHPEAYKDFLDSAVKDWLDFSVKQLRSDGYQSGEALLMATVVLAGLRGFLMDLYATHDRARVNRAVAAWLKTLGTLVSQKKGKRR